MSDGIESESIWCDKGAGKVRVRVLRVQRNGRIAFERLTGPRGVMGKEVRCDRDQFLCAFQPESAETGQHRRHG